MEIIIFWCASGVIGYMIGKGKGEGKKGAILSLLLGPLGWLIVALSAGDRKTCPHCKSKIHRDATTCTQCHRSVAIGSTVVPAGTFKDISPQPEASRQCPFCAEDIKAAAIVCKHCGKDLAAA